MDTQALAALANGRHDWRPEARPADLDAARKDGERVTARTLMQRCRRAADAAVPTRAEHEREDLAADLAEWVADRHGWTPRRSEVRHGWLTLKARRKAAAWSTWKDQLGRPGHAAVDADTSGSVLAQAADLPRGVLEADAVRLADTLELDSDESAAVLAVLAGRGSALELAARLDIGHAAARKRLQRGRAKLALRWPTARHAAEALADIAARDDALDAAAQPVPVDGRYPHHLEPDGPTRAARVLAWIDAAPHLGRMLEADPNPTLRGLMHVDPGSHAADLERDPRTAGPEYPAASLAGPQPTRAAAVLAWIGAVESGRVRWSGPDRWREGTLPGWIDAPELPPRERVSMGPDRGGYVSPIGSDRAEEARQRAAVDRCEAYATRAACERLPLPRAGRVLAYMDRVSHLTG